MGRSGYAEDWDDQWGLIRYRGAVKSALTGKRGQAFLKEMLAALDALPEKKLIVDELVHEGAVCAIGAVGVARGIDMNALDPHDPETIAGAFNLADAMAREIVYENDECGGHKETPEQRFTRMRAWVEGHILKPATAYFGR